jgi:site-specific DNA-methyltransferase (adenine-specific)
VQPISWKTKLVKIQDLKDYPHNPRKIEKKELDKLTQHIQQDGYHQRLLVNEDLTIIGGHQRKKALLKAGMSANDEVEVLVSSRSLSQEELDRLNIRDNLPFGEYDFDILSNRFDASTLLEFGMPEEWLKGFGDDALLAETQNPPEIKLPETTRVKEGNIYQLGKHRLMCGDSTNPEHVDKLLSGNNPILMVTDPPYGVEYDPSWREGCNLGVGERSKGKVLNDDRIDWSEAYLLFPGDVAYIWHSAKNTHKFAESIENSGFELISLILWAKQHFVISRGDYHNQHEPLWYAVKKGKNHNWQGKRDQSTLWQIANNNAFGNSDKEQTYGHGTQKPLECMLRPILNNSAPGEAIYDPFGGSGTTLTACEKSDRICYMMELSPGYVDVIIQRWEQTTGKKAVLEAKISETKTTKEDQ